MNTSSPTGADHLGGRVALVTGGSRGIGRAIAEALIAHGARVIITGRNADNLERAEKQLGAAVMAVQADVRATDDVQRAVRRGVDRFGAIDILINNAGVGVFKNAADMSVAEWQTVLETNLSGVFYACRAVIPHLRERGGGWIINISSLASKNPFAGGAAYSASKAALNAFSEALMQEVRYENIRVSYVLPGSVATEFSGRGASGKADWKVPPEDVARVVIDLLMMPPRSLPSRVELRPSKPQK
jgi:3-oxoacyl-[acyl-carrier protein] reductase